MADLASAVARAKQAGYTDAEIAAHIAADPAMGPKVAAARKAGYSDAEIVGHLASAPPPPKRSLVDDATGFLAKVNRGLGVGDELAAGFATARDVATGHSGPNIVQTYKDEMRRQRQTEDSYQAAHPNLAALATGTGNALTMAAPVGPGAEAFQGAIPLVGKLAIPAGRAANALRGATLASATAAGYAAVDRGSPSERLAAASRASRDPVVLALGAGAGALATRGRQRPQKAPAPTLEELTARKEAAYKAVDDSGVRYRPEAFHGLTEDMAKALDEAGFHAGLHPKTAAMMERLGQSERATKGYSPTLTQLDQLRQQIGSDLAGSSDAGERRLGMLLRDRIDAFIDKAGPAEMTGDAAGNASVLIRRARDLNTRVQKIRSLDRLDEAAEDRASGTGSGGNINNATRQNAIRFKNKTKNLTPAEREAAQRVISGTPAGNALRQVGKLSPEGNGLMVGGHLIAAFGTGGHSVPVAGVGYVAKRVADAMTARNVSALRDLIATGGEAAAEVSRQLATQPEASDLRRQLANDLAVAAGVQGTARRHAVEVYVEGHPEYGVGTSRK